MGKHSAPKTQSKKKAAVIAATGVAIAAGAVLLSGGTAQAVTTSQWDKIAQAEAGGDWSINYSGDGQSVGGLQFQNRSWQDALAYLRTKGYDTSSWPQTLYQGMPRSSVPTKSQQITAGEALLALQADPWTASHSLSGVYLSQSDSAFRGGPTPAGFLQSSGNTPTPTPIPTSNSMTPHAAAAIAWAKQYADGGSKQRTLSYVFGAEGPYSYDCSSFQMAAWRSTGVNIPRDTESMRLQMTHVSQTNMRPGDLILWHFSGTSQDGDVSNHVSMYLGGGKTIEMHTRTPNDVTIDSLATRQQSGTIVGIVRPEPNVQPSTPTPTPAPTPKPTPKPEPAGTYKIYTVKSGDYLFKIAKHFYGTGAKWRDIYNANKTVIGGDPDLILPGQMLTIPGVKA